MEEKSRVELDYKVQLETSVDIQNLQKFLNVPGYKAGKNNPYTNIIDQGSFKNYVIPTNDHQDSITHFFNLLEHCRRKNLVINYSERQYYEERGTNRLIQKSGIMFDFDILQKTGTIQINETHYHQLSQFVVQLLNELLDLSMKNYKQVAGEKNIFIVFIRKPEIVAINHPKYGECYKDGFHMLIPGIKVSKPVKRYLRDQLLQRDLLVKVFGDVDCVNHFDEILDAGSISVPVLLLGNSKRGKPSYKLDKVYKMIIKFQTDFITLSDCTDSFTNEDNNCNLTREFSLHYESINGLIRKCEYNCKPDIEREIEIFDERHKGNTDIKELKKVENELSILTIHDPKSREIKKLLTILNPKRAEDYDTWKKIIILLAGINPNYKPLAVSFSQRCPESWQKGGMAELEKIWEWALNNEPQEGQKITIASLHYMAKMDDPDKYKEIQDDNMFNNLYEAVIENKGDLNHFDIACHLYKMYPNKFIYDEDPASTKATGKWYEFVLPGDNMIKGEVFKYRHEKNPDNLRLCMAKILPKKFKHMKAFIKERRENSQDENAQKYYAYIGKRFDISCRRLGDFGFTTSVINQSRLLFRQRGFEKNLDKDPMILGVGNGVLKLGSKVELIQSYHPYYVMRYTDVDYIPLDAENPFKSKNPYVRTLIKAVRNLFDTEDKFEYTMIYLSTSLDGRTKDSIFYLWFGEGSNGKSFLLEMHINTLGEDYGEKLPIAFIVGKRPAADKSNPVFMRLKHARFAYFSEGEPGQILNMAIVKEFTGGETLSGRSHHQEQQKFEPHCHFVSASNYKFRLDDPTYGACRRIRVCNFKMKFCDKPEQGNPFEKKADDRFIKSVKKDPNYKRAWLTILVYYYQKYYNTYNAKLSQIPHPTIEQETLDYLNEQDTVGRFITQRLRQQPGADSISIQELATKYCDWHIRNIVEERLVKTEIIQQLKNSSLSRYITKRMSGDFLTDHILLEDGECENNQFCSNESNNQQDDIIDSFPTDQSESDEIQQNKEDRPDNVSECIPDEKQFMQ